jgi:hypothetical protein
MMGFDTGIIWFFFKNNFLTFDSKIVALSLSVVAYLPHHCPPPKGCLFSWSLGFRVYSLQLGK